MKKIYLLLFITGLIFTLVSCGGGNTPGLEPVNSYQSEIKIGYRQYFETQYTENNIFDINEDIYIKISFENYLCTTCGSETQKTGTFLITFTFLEEQSEPTQNGGLTFKPVPNSELGEKQYQVELQFTKTSKNGFATFHMRPIRAGIISFTVVLLENDSIDYTGRLDVRSNES